MTTKTATPRKRARYSARRYIDIVSTIDTGSGWIRKLPSEEQSIVRDIVPLMEKLSKVSDDLHVMEVVTRTLETYIATRAKVGNNSNLPLAIMRGKLAREELKQQEGGHISASEAANALGISKPALLKRYNLGQVLGWREAKQDAVRLPGWQFKGDHLLPGLPEVLKILNSARWMDDWGRVLFFLNPLASMGGKRPLDLLRSGNLQDVINLAKAAIE